MTRWGLIALVVVGTVVGIAIYVAIHGIANTEQVHSHHSVDDMGTPLHAWRDTTVDSRVRIERADSVPAKVDASPTLFVCDQQGIAVVGASVRLGGDAQSAIASGDSQETNNDGLVSLEECTKSRWLFVSSSGLIPFLASPRDALWTKDEFVVVLHRAVSLEVQVLDIFGAPVPGAQVSLFGRWGKEASEIVPESPIKARLFPSSITGVRGRCKLDVAPRTDYRVEVSALGFASRRVSADRDSLISGSVDVTIEPIVMAGLSLPTYKGSEEMVRARISRRSFDKTAFAKPKAEDAAALEAHLEAMYPFGGYKTMWFFRVQKDVSAYPARKRFAILTEDQEQPFFCHATFRRLSEVEPPQRIPVDAPYKAPTGRVQVTFDPSPPTWPVFLIEEDAGRGLFGFRFEPSSIEGEVYIFDVPEGEYVLSPGYAVPTCAAVEYERTPIKVERDETLKVTVASDESVGCIVAFDIHDHEGRQVTHFSAKLALENDPFLGSIYRAFGESKELAKPLRLKRGHYTLYVGGAFGYAPQEQKVEITGQRCTLVIELHADS